MVVGNIPDGINTFKLVYQEFITTYVCVFYHYLIKRPVTAWRYWEKNKNLIVVGTNSDTSDDAPATKVPEDETIEKCIMYKTFQYYFYLAV